MIASSFLPMIPLCGTVRRLGLRISQIMHDPMLYVKDDGVKVWVLAWTFLLYGMASAAGSATHWSKTKKNILLNSRTSDLLIDVKMN